MGCWYARLLTGAAYFVLFCASAAPLRADDSTDIDLQEISRRLTQWRNSFANLRVVWELRSLPESEEPVVEWPPPPDPETASLFLREEWTWADHGLDRLEIWSFFYEDGTSKGHSIDVFNGPKGVVFRAQFQKPTLEGPEKFLDLQLFGLGTGKPTSFQDRAAMNGLYWPVTAEWLPETFSRWKWQFEGVDDVGGQPCARIAAARDETKEFPVVEVLWLDLEHDCLVRRHRARSLSGQLALGRDFIVDEFQRLEGGVWFPRRGRIELAGIPHEHQIFVVTDAAVNESLDLSRFDPPAPEVGTVVAGHGTSYRHGIAAPAADQGASMNVAGPPDFNGASGQASSQFASAAAPTVSRIGWSVGLASAAVIFLVVGFWFSQRNKENGP